MLNITDSAAEQIRESARQSDAENMDLRISAKRGTDGNIEYALGFDEEGDNDTRVTANGINVLISAYSHDLLQGATLDYVELNPGEYRFIFSNPNDPAHSSAQ